GPAGASLHSVRNPKRLSRPSLTIQSTRVRRWLKLKFATRARRRTLGNAIGEQHQRAVGADRKRFDACDLRGDDPSPGRSVNSGGMLRLRRVESVDPFGIALRDLLLEGAYASAR